MRPFLPRRGFAVALLGLLVGCHGLSKERPYPADPLFAVKKPQQMSPEKAEPVILVATAPEAPPVPTTVLAARQAPRDPGMLPEYRVGYPPAGTSP